MKPFVTSVLYDLLRSSIEDIISGVYNSFKLLLYYLNVPHFLFNFFCCCCLFNNPALIIIIIIITLKLIRCPATETKQEFLQKNKIQKNKFKKKVKKCVQTKACGHVLFEAKEVALYTPI